MRLSQGKKRNQPILMQRLQKMEEEKSFKLDNLNRIMAWVCW